MLSNADKREELKKVKHFEEIVSTLCLLLVAVTMFSKFNIDKWMISALGIGGSKLEYIVFPLLIIFEVTLARTSINIMPLIFLLFTALLATLATYGVLIYFLLYTFLFIAAEIKLIAMKMTKGYPLFQDEPVKRPAEYSKAKPEPFRIVENDDDNDDPESYMSRMEKMTSADKQPDEYISSDAYGMAEQMEEISLPEDFYAEEINDSKKDR